MKLWKLSQNKNNSRCSISAAVVAAETERDARYTYPSLTETLWVDGEWRFCDDGVPVGGFDPRADWCAPKDMRVEHLGEAISGTVAGALMWRNYDDPW